MEKYNIHDFIKYTKENPLKYISYCEVIIDPYGNIIIASPSHTETVVKYVMEKENKTRQELKKEIPMHCLPLEWCVDKYGLIAVWYCGYMYSAYKRTPNRFQRKGLDILLENGLIKEEYIQPANEYKNYLYRKSLGIED